LIGFGIISITLGKTWKSGGLEGWKVGKYPALHPSNLPFFLPYPRIFAQINFEVQNQQPF
jgi:hypothetical protein